MSACVHAQAERVLLDVRQDGEGARRVMAHRKPLGTTCKIHFASDTWEQMPQLGDQLISEAGTCYLIVGVEEGTTRTNYVCERVAAVHPGRRLYSFYWLRRDRAA